MSAQTAKQVCTAYVAAKALRAEHGSALESLLHDIPKASSQDIPGAVAALLEAADQYKASSPIVDKAGLRSKPAIAKARATVDKLDKTLQNALDQLGKLPINAVTAVTDAQDAPLGKLSADLNQIHAVIKTALAKVNGEPNKAADHARNVLAYHVAVVFRDILKLKPSAARDNAITITNARGGAAYARVLRSTLAAAGVHHVDIGPLIDAGRALLSDPDLPP